MKKNTISAARFKWFLKHNCCEVNKCLSYKVSANNLKRIMEDLQIDEETFYSLPLQTFKKLAVILQDSPSFRNRGEATQINLKNTIELYIAMVRFTIYSKLDIGVVYTKEGLLVNKVAFRNVKDEVVKFESQDAIAAVEIKKEIARSMGIKSKSEVYQKIMREKKKVEKAVSHLNQVFFNSSFFQVAQPAN